MHIYDQSSGYDRIYALHRQIRPCTFFCTPSLSPMCNLVSFSSSFVTQNGKRISYWGENGAPLPPWPSARCCGLDCTANNQHSDAQPFAGTVAKRAVGNDTQESSFEKRDLPTQMEEGDDDRGAQRDHHQHDRKHRNRKDDGKRRLDDLDE